MITYSTHKHTQCMCKFCLYWPYTMYESFQLIFLQFDIKDVSCNSSIPSIHKLPFKQDIIDYAFDVISKIYNMCRENCFASNSISLNLIFKPNYAYRILDMFQRIICERLPSKINSICLMQHPVVDVNPFSAYIRKDSYSH